MITKNALNLKKMKLTLANLYIAKKLLLAS